METWINARGAYRLLIDLGSNVTLLRRIVVDAARVTVLVERATTDIVRVASLRIGDLDLANVTVASYDTLDVDGVLGYNVLQHASFTLDFPARRLVWHRRASAVTLWRLRWCSSTRKRRTRGSGRPR